MRYHTALEKELQEVAGVFFDIAPAWRARLHNAIRGRLIAQPIEAVLPEPIPVRVLGREPARNLWLDVALRNTIERAWFREDKYFFRKVGEG